MIQRMKYLGVAAVIAALTLTGIPAMGQPIEESEVRLTTPESASVATSGNGILVLLDTSGSMAEEDGSDRVKIDAAKTSLLEQAQALPLDTKLGLMTYPDSAPELPEGRCGVSREVLPVAKGSTQQLGTELVKLAAPNGDTPTGDALLSAAEYLDENGLRNVPILLVSDGESTCGETPVCDVAANLKTLGVSVQINTVGFDVSEQGEEELNCIADVSGGRYVNAKDSDELRAVLSSVSNAQLEMNVVHPSSSLPKQISDFPVEAEVSIIDENFGAGIDQPVKLILDEIDPASGKLRGIGQRIELGRLSPGQPVTRSFKVPTRNVSGESLYRVSAYAAGHEQVSTEFTIKFVDAPDFNGANLPEVLREFDNVMVLGDSYSSGEGAKSSDRPYFTDGSQHPDCHRTKNQYASWLYNQDMVDIIACSGAVTSNFSGIGQHGEKTQVKQLAQRIARGETPDLMLLTIGGNDINFSGIAKDCFAKQFFFGENVYEYCLASDKSGGPYAETLSLINKLDDSLAESLADVSDIFQDRDLPTPPILVLHYPKLFPANEGQAQRCSDKWVVQEANLGPSYENFSKVQGLLKTAVEDGVGQAQAKGIPAQLVIGSEESIPATHNSCTEDPWINPLVALKLFSPESLHPNRSGHQAMAVSVGQWAAQYQPNLEAKVVETEDPMSGWRDIFEDSIDSFEKLRPKKEVTIDMSEAPDSDVTIKLNHGPMTIKIIGGEPGGTSTIYLRSDPYVLGSVTFDENGEATLDASIPIDKLPAGDHTLISMGANSDGEYVVAKTPVQISKPVPVFFWVLAGCVVLAAAGILLLVRSLRRQRTDNA